MFLAPNLKSFGGASNSKNRVGGPIRVCTHKIHSVGGVFSDPTWPKSLLLLLFPVRRARLHTYSPARELNDHSFEFVTKSQRFVCNFYANSIR
jgi:hypothetical protein